MNDLWNMVDILWSLIPGKIRVGTREILPEKINLSSAKDLRDFFLVICGRPFLFPLSLPYPTISVVNDPDIDNGLDVGSYLYRFTATTDYGETTPGEPIEVIIPEKSTVTWKIRSYLDGHAIGFNVYRSAKLSASDQTPYSKIPCIKRYTVIGRPEVWTDDGTDSEVGGYPPTKNTATYDPDFMDPSNTLDEIRNKIRRIDEVIDLDKAHEDILPYFFYFLRSDFDSTKDIEEQVNEFKGRVPVVKIKSTIPSVKRILRKRRRELNFTTGSTLDGVYEPYRDIMKYSLSTLSGTKVYPNTGIRRYSNTGTLKRGTDIILEDLSGPFTDTEEGYFIRMPFEGGSRNGFKISSVISDTQVVIPQAEVIWNDPKYRGESEITGIKFFVLVAGRDSHHITDWPYYHHGVYEVKSTLPPPEYKAELLEEVHVAGTRLWFVFVVEMEKVLAHYGEVKDKDIGLYIQPDVKSTVCGIRPGTTPALSTNGAKLSGCIAELEEIGLYIYITGSGGAPVPARRVPHFTPNLKFYDLYGVIGYLDTAGNSTIWTDQYGYRWGDLPPYLDAQPPHMVNKVIHTGSPGKPSITKGPADSQDEFIPPITKRVTDVLQVNESGIWDNITGSFIGGTDYIEGTDWILTIDDTVFPWRFFIDWSLPGAEPPPSAIYNIVYALEE